uniref:c-type cytochrome biogenensis protein n=1 Tax=Lithothamnion corallioides TaxID=1277934 RepID=UPI0023F14D81|nr:c-type cytochrome biogenensis protein [Lithothamnion corallioides]WEA76964.1 c-type cytochrome biogenensis protein [Lithothamnion corallioides]
MSFKNLLWNFLKKLSSLSISIVMLLSIALVSILGTIIEQDQSIEYYKLNYPVDQPLFYFFTWKQIVNYNLNHVYSNIWFIVLLLLFFLSLFVCTMSTQLPVLKRARQWKFFHNKTSLNKFTSRSIVQDESFINFIYLLNLKNYYIFHKGNALYAYKGLLGRVAPIFVHFSIIFTLTGAFIGLFGGFFAQEMIPVGEIFHFQNIVRSGYISKLPVNILAKVNNLNISYNRDNSIQQFFSNLSILNNQGIVIYNKTISVNNPLRFRGLTFYQTDWQVNALRLRLGSRYIFEKPLNKITNKETLSVSWFCNLFVSADHQVSIFVTDLKDSILIYDSDGILITETKYGLWNVVYGVPIVIQDLMTSTGLQIKIDPGIQITYLGFLILMISIVASYQSFSQIWANSSGNILYFSGVTNRAFLSFEDEMSLIYRTYINLSNSFE